MPPRSDRPIDLALTVQHRRLGELNKLIRDSWECSEDIAEKAREIGNQAVTERILCGKYLNEMKAIVGHGKWLAWLAEHRPEISSVSAWRAMKMANLSRLKDLSEAKCITDAYRICGILPDLPAAEDPGEPPPPYDSALIQFSRLRNRYEETTFTEWPSAKVEQLRSELAPLVRKLWPDVPIAAHTGGTSDPGPPGKESFTGGVPSGG